MEEIMTLDELRRHAADLFPQASAYAIHRPGERNEAFEALERLCWDYYESLGFDCMADCFTAVAPRIEGRLSLDAWSSTRVEFRGWIIETSLHSLKFCGNYAHIEIFHDGELPGVTETGYLSRFIPMATFAERTPDDFLSELLSGLPLIRQLSLF
jgi:hypothetical protein